MCGDRPFRSKGAEHDWMFKPFRADKFFVLNSHAKLMRLLRKNRGSATTYTPIAS